MVFKLSRPAGASKLLLEVLMIVVGINVALWFESWFQDLQDAELAEEYLVDLRDDLLMDLENLDFVIRNGEAKSERVAKVIENIKRIAELPPEDQAMAIYTPPNYQFFTPSDFTYRSMQESGDFRLLKNADIKKSILKLDRSHKHIAMLQKNFLQAMDDGYLPLMMNAFDIATLTVTDTGLFDDQLFQNFFVYTKQDTDGMVAAYRATRSESEELIELIEQELAR